MNLFAQITDRQLETELRHRKEEVIRREFRGTNLPFYIRMEELSNYLYKGILSLPNLVEIDAAAFAAHPAISGSYYSKMLGSTRVGVNDVLGIKFERYARVLMVTMNHNAGRGVAFLAVPADDPDWSKSQHYQLELKLRHWSFHVCDHRFFYKHVGHCSTDYSCEKCGWTYNVDSSG